MTSFGMIDLALLAHVSGGNQTTDAQCVRTANDQYHLAVQRNAGTITTGQDEHDVLEKAFSDSRAGLQRCQTRANAALGAGLTPNMLNFEQLTQ